MLLLSFKTVSNRVISCSCGIRYFNKRGGKKLIDCLENMIKANNSRITDAQKQRLNIQKKSEKYAPSTVYLQTLGSGAIGASNTLYMFTDQKRYLFNCGEGTQRLAHEHKVKLSRLDHIFVTNKTWKNIGGLPGLSLTLQDVGVPNITLHGPEGLDDLYHATRRFVIMKDMNVTMAPCSPLEDFEDGVMTVKYVLLYNPNDEILLKDGIPNPKRQKLNDNKEFEEFVNDDTDYYKHSDRGKTSPTRDKHQKKSKPICETDPKKKTDQMLLGLEKRSTCSVQYICTLKKRAGTLDLEKCVELGVKPGPLLGQLKNGQDVVLPDGKIVLSKDVKNPDDPGPIFIVMDVPDIGYLKEDEFKSHFDDGTNSQENIPSVVVHFTQAHVMNHPKYRGFMRKFGASTRHLVLNEQNSCLGSEAVHRTQQKLHLIDPDIFPLLRDISVPAVWEAQPTLPKTTSPVRLKGLEELKNRIAHAQFQNLINLEGAYQPEGHGQTEESNEEKLEIISGRTLTMFHLRPKRQLDRASEPKLHIQEYLQEVMDQDGFISSLEHFRHVVDGLQFTNKTSQKEYPKVVFLGTGSCIPSKTRNTSGILVQIDENHSMLLDCGEGTFGQLVRFFGPKRVSHVLRTLKAVYVSHLHADHHIGLIGLVQGRKRAFVEENLPANEIPPLYLLAPGQIMSWLQMYDQQFEKIRGDYTIVPNQSLLMGSNSGGEMTSAILSSIGVEDLRTCLVSHCPNAFGVAITLNDNKITYSGDTIPCDALVQLGEDSTLLIHEATMEDELAEEARIKMHSTTSQAIEIGQRMNAKFTVLTHFSQRYARLPRLNSNILEDNKSAGIAFDNMQISMSDLPLLPYMYAPLQLMFAEHCVEMELKAQHRARVKERRRRTSANMPGGTQIRNHTTHAENIPNQQVENNPAKGDNVKSPPVKSPNLTSYMDTYGSALMRACKRDLMSATDSNRGAACSQLQRSIYATLRNRTELPDATAGSSQSLTNSKDGSKYSGDMNTVINSSSRTINSVNSSIARIRSARRSSDVNIIDYDLNREKKRVVSPTKKFINSSKEQTPVYQSTVKTSGSKSKCRPESPNWRDSLRNYSAPPATNLNRLRTVEIHRTDVSTRHCNSAPAKNVTPVTNKWCITNINSKHIAARSTNAKNSFTPRSYLSANCYRVASPIKVLNSKTIDRNPVRSVRKPPPNLQKNCIRHESPPSERKKIIKDDSERTTLIVKSYETQKHISGSNWKSPFGGRPQSNKMKSFKPQLEDIKSSYLLLNKNEHKKFDKWQTGPSKPMITVNKPKPFNEAERQQQLLASKMKFSTKKFVEDSRYDKIEGLNWISWN